MEFLAKEGQQEQRFLGIFRNQGMKKTRMGGKRDAMQEVLIDSYLFQGVPRAKILPVLF